MFVLAMTGFEGDHRSILNPKATIINRIRKMILSKTLLIA